MLIPVVITALAIGRSFNYKTLKSGSYYIFDQTSAAKNLQTIHRPFTTSHYQLVESSSDVNDFLDINGEISLKSKRGQVDVQGFGEYAIKSVNREKTVEMLISVYHETLTETLPSYATLRTDWVSRRPKDIGTHYIRSIVYGGRLIISYKMIANSSQNMEKIKAYLSGSMDSSGLIDAKIAGNLEKLEKEIGSSYKLAINAYATTGGDIYNPTNMKAVLEMVEAYPASVKKINNGKGSPLKLELIPIATLNQKFRYNPRTVAMETIVDDATNKYDDMNVANTEFKAWESTKLWNEDQQKTINAYHRRLKAAYKEMIQAISQLDISAKEDLHHFDDAFEAYGKDGENIPNRYMRELIKLQHEVEQIPFQWYPYTKAITHYIHWGSINCTSPSPEPLYIGYAATSPEGFGNGGNFLCLDSTPSLGLKPSTDQLVSQVNGLKYQDPLWNTGVTYCAFCKLENATSVFTIPARKECPPEMKLEYSGVLTTNGLMESNYVCLDGTPDGNIANLKLKEDPIAGKLVPVWAKCHECEDGEEQFVPCVVCSR